jgi:hypothetical protein
VNSGWASETLLDTYETERRPVGVRNTLACRQLASDVATIEVPENLEEDNESGKQARLRLGAHLLGFDEEFASLGIQLGARYDGSPIISAEETAPPLSSAVEYIPTTHPGGRAPHIWLNDGASILDRFGVWFTLLKLGGTQLDCSGLESAANYWRVPLLVVEITEPAVRKLYQRDLVLIRPDGHVAWRKDALPGDPYALIGEITSNAELTAENP